MKPAKYALTASHSINYYRSTFSRYFLLNITKVFYLLQKFDL